MKRMIALFVTGLLLLSLSACGNTSAPQSAQPSEQSPAGNVETSIQQITGEESSEPQESSVANPETTESTVLVAYFSCTGNTEAVAQTAAELLGADLYEIVPEDPYTAEDLRYSDSSTRATVEQHDPDIRPAISGSVENMSQYDVILLGYPLWWGQAPRIINTFLESYDFSGKTVILFCTSSSSGIENSEAELQALYADSVRFGEGARFAAGAEQDEISTWLSEAGLF